MLNVNRRIHSEVFIQNNITIYNITIVYIVYIYNITIYKYYYIILCNINKDYFLHKIQIFNLFKIEYEKNVSSINSHFAYYSKITNMHFVHNYY